MKQIKLRVSVYWLMNHLIHNHHEVLFIESNNDSSDKKHIICKWNDKFYQEHKFVLHERLISFITITENEIRVYLVKDETL